MTRPRPIVVVEVALLLFAILGCGFVVNDDLRARAVVKHMRSSNALLSQQLESSPTASGVGFRLGKQLPIGGLLRPNGQPAALTVPHGGAYVWAFDPDCGVCTQQAPAIRLLLAQHVPIIAISIGDGPSTAKFETDQHILATRLKDPKELGVAMTPQFARINEQGMTTAVFSAPDQLQCR